MKGQRQRQHSVDAKVAWFAVELELAFPVGDGKD
jgi:hypothetical protein